MGRRVGGDRTGLLAAVLIALSPCAIFYSDEARAYATMMFLVTLSMLALLRALDGGRRRWWIVFALCSCAALWSHYTAVFVIAAESAWAAGAHRERLRVLTVAVGAIAVGYLPWVPGFLEQRKNHLGIEVINFFSPLSLGRIFELPLRTLVGHPFLLLSDEPGDKGLLVVAVVAVLAITAALLHPALRRPQTLQPSASWLRSERALVAILAVATPVGLLIYALGGTSLYGPGPRNLLASLPALAVAVGLVLNVLTRAVPTALATVGVSALAVLLAVTAVQSVGDDQRRPAYRDVAHYLDRVAGPADPVSESAIYPGVDLHLGSTLNLYFHRAHRVYRSGQGDAAAWRELLKGRSVYRVTFSPRLLGGVQLVPPDALEQHRRLGGPAGRAVLRERKTFAGITPLTVLRYAGVVDGQLEGRRGREVLSWSLGKHVKVSPGAARGAVDRVPPATQPLRLDGWAMDATRPLIADWLLAFERGRLIAVAPCGRPRPDVAKVYGDSALLSGFSLAPVETPRDRAAIRVFAIVDGRASELPLSPAARRALR